jgi:hypothetical protein
MMDLRGSSCLTTHDQSNSPTAQLALFVSQSGHSSIDSDCIPGYRRAWASHAGFDAAKMHGDTTGLNPLLLLLLAQRKKSPAMAIQMLPSKYPVYGI